MLAFLRQVQPSGCVLRPMEQNPCGWEVDNVFVDGVLVSCAHEFAFRLRWVEQPLEPVIEASFQPSIAVCSESAKSAITHANELNIKDRRPGVLDVLEDRWSWLVSDRPNVADAVARLAVEYNVILVTTDGKHCSAFFNEDFDSDWVGVTSRGFMCGFPPSGRRLVRHSTSDGETHAPEEASYLLGWNPYRNLAEHDECDDDAYDPSEWFSTHDPDALRALIQSAHAYLPSDHTSFSQAMDAAALLEESPENLSEAHSGGENALDAPDVEGPHLDALAAGVNAAFGLLDEGPAAEEWPAEVPTVDDAPAEEPVAAPSPAVMEQGDDEVLIEAGELPDNLAGGVAPAQQCHAHEAFNSPRGSEPAEEVAPCVQPELPNVVTVPAKAPEAGAAVGAAIATDPGHERLGRDARREPATVMEGLDELAVGDEPDRESPAADNHVNVSQVVGAPPDLDDLDMTARPRSEARARRDGATADAAQPKRATIRWGPLAPRVCQRSAAKIEARRSLAVDFGRSNRDTTCHSAGVAAGSKGVVPIQIRTTCPFADIHHFSTVLTPQNGNPSLGIIVLLPSALPDFPAGGESNVSPAQEFAMMFRQVAHWMRSPYGRAFSHCAFEQGSIECPTISFNERMGYAAPNLAAQPSGQGAVYWHEGPVQSDGIKVTLVPTHVRDVYVGDASVQRRVCAALTALSDDNRRNVLAFCAWHNPQHATSTALSATLNAMSGKGWTRPFHQMAVHIPSEARVNGECSRARVTDHPFEPHERPNQDVMRIEGGVGTALIRIDAVLRAKRRQDAEESQRGAGPRSNTRTRAHR